MELSPWRRSRLTEMPKRRWMCRLRVVAKAAKGVVRIWLSQCPQIIGSNIVAPAATSASASAGAGATRSR